MSKVVKNTEAEIIETETLDAEVNATEVNEIEINDAGINETGIEINEELPAEIFPPAEELLAKIVEAALMVAGRPLGLDELSSLFDEQERPSPTAILKALERIRVECQTRGVELKEIASGYRFTAKQELAGYLARLWDEKPQKYTRATLETMALIAYKQPITRGEIEEIRGVTVNTQTIKTLMERDWIRVVGHRDVPGRPALYATTRQFLDYFNLKSLDQLPSLAELKDFDSLNVELNFEEARQTGKTEAEPDAELEKAVARMEQEQAIEAAMDEAGISDPDDVPPSPSVH